MKAIPKRYRLTRLEAKLMHAIQSLLMYAPITYTVKGKRRKHA